MAGEQEAAVYVAGHGFTPGSRKFGSGPPTCLVMLSRYPCPYTEAEHDPALAPVDVDVFGYRRTPASPVAAGESEEGQR